MARAFIASVPMGVVLVAALVVPLAVIPGTFGFDSWPSSPGASVTERQVRLPAPKVDVVAVRPREAVPERHPVLLAAKPVVAPRPSATTTVALAPAPHRAPVVRGSTPAPKPDRRPSQPARPQPQPQQRAQPQPQPTKNDSQLLAGRDVPVARDLPSQEAPQPAPAPAPAPQPVPAAPAPVERAVPSEPCHGGGDQGGEQGGHGHGGGQHGDGRSSE